MSLRHPRYHNYYKDPNEIRRRCKIINWKIRNQQVLIKNIEEIESKVSKIKWIKETELERLQLYEELGNLYKIYRINRIYIERDHYHLLKSVNLTG